MDDSYYFIFSRNLALYMPDDFSENALLDDDPYAMNDR